MGNAAPSRGRLIAAFGGSGGRLCHFFVLARPPPLPPKPLFGPEFPPAPIWEAFFPNF